MMRNVFTHRNVATTLALVAAGLALALLLVALAQSQPASAQTPPSETNTAHPTPTVSSEIVPHNEQVPPLESKISPPGHDGLDYILNELVGQYETGAFTAKGTAREASMDKEEFVAVTFYIEEGHVRDVWNFLQSNEIPALEPADDERFIEAEVPVSFLARASRSRPSWGVGGQGAAARGARAWHSAGYRGQGVKVGIIDTGFQGFSRLQGAELPSSVVARCYWGTSVSSSLSACADRGGHGTRVTEVLYETAPGATYYIAEAGSKGKFRKAAQWMASQGVDVINISFSYVWDGPEGGTSPYTDSPLKSVDIAVSGSAVVTVAAGNYGEQTRFGGFDDPDKDGDLDFVAGDECNALTPKRGKRIWAYVRWQDTWRGATKDLDLYLYREAASGLSIVARSENAQSGSRVPLYGRAYVRMVSTPGRGSFQSA